MGCGVQQWETRISEEFWWQVALGKRIQLTQPMFDGLWCAGVGEAHQRGVPVAGRAGEAQPAAGGALHGGPERVCTRAQRDPLLGGIRAAAVAGRSGPLPQLDAPPSQVQGEPETVPQHEEAISQNSEKPINASRSEQEPHAGNTRRSLRVEFPTAGASSHTPYLFVPRFVEGRMTLAETGKKL